MAASNIASHPTHPDIDLVSGEFYARPPHDLFAWMRLNAPVYYDEANDVWGVASYHLLREVARDPETFSNAGGIRPGLDPLPMMIDMDDPDHFRRRKLVNKGFTPRRVRDLEPKIRAACDEIIDSVCETGTCDLVRDIAAPLPMIMIGDALGVAPEDRADLLRWSDDMVSSQSSGATDEDLAKAGDAFAAYLTHCSGVIAERRSRPPDTDLMSVLVHAEIDGDKLADDELIHESLLILIGGDETTRHVISGGTEALVRHPHEREKLLARPELLPSAVEEMLRWVSPLKNMARTATRDVELNGQHIAQGTKLLLLYPSANRDEEVFDDPQRFDVERHPNDHVAFGFGTHFCLGASLARLELNVMFERLLARMPDLDIVGDAPLRAANFVSGFEEMPVQFTPSERVGVPA